LTIFLVFLQIEQSILCILDNLQSLESLVAKLNRKNLTDIGQSEKEGKALVILGYSIILTQYAEVTAWNAFLIDWKLSGVIFL
jgi:hypothetical protein